MYTPINTLQVGETYKQTWLVSASNKNSHNGKTFLQVTLIDRTGSIKGVCWNFKETIKSGSYINLTVDITEYRGTKQFVCRDSSIYIVADPQEDYYLRGLTDQEIEVYWKEILVLVDLIEDKYLRAILEYQFLQDVNNIAKIKWSPARAHSHGNYRGGLVEHLYRVTKLAIKIADQHEDQAKIDKDMVIAGALLHDIGKIFCYDKDGLGFSANNHEKLIGHTALGFNMLTHLFIGVEGSLKEEIPRNIKLNLTHIVLSHHGKLEWNAIVVPKTIEALVVSSADYLDARMNLGIALINNKSKDQEWTDYCNVLKTDIWSA